MKLLVLIAAVAFAYVALEAHAAANDVATWTAIAASLAMSIIAKAMK